MSNFQYEFQGPYSGSYYTSPCFYILNVYKPRLAGGGKATRKIDLTTSVNNSGCRQAAGPRTLRT